MSIMFSAGDLAYIKLYLLDSPLLYYGFPPNMEDKKKVVEPLWPIQDNPSRFHAIPKPALRMRVW